MLLPLPPSPSSLIPRPHVYAPTTLPLPSLPYTPRQILSTTRPQIVGQLPLSVLALLPPLPTLVANLGPNRYPCRARPLLRIHILLRVPRQPTYPCRRPPQWAFRQARNASAGAGTATTASAGSIANVVGSGRSRNAPRASRDTRRWRRASTTRGVSVGSNLDVRKGLFFVLSPFRAFAYPPYLQPFLPCCRRRGCAVEGQWPSAGDLYIATCHPITSSDDGLARLENINEKTISETTTTLLLVAQSSHCTTTPLFMANHFVSLFSLQFSSSLSRSYSFIVHCSLPPCLSLTLSSSLPLPLLHIISHSTFHISLLHS